MKKIDIPGEPKDYYVALKNDDGNIEYSALRGKIRQLVEIHQLAVKKIVDDGGNSHTAVLDISDEIKDFISKEPVLAQTAFYETLTQEMEAKTATHYDEINKLNTIAGKKAESEMNLAAIASWVGAAIFFIVIMAIINH